MTSTDTRTPPAAPTSPAAPADRAAPRDAEATDQVAFDALKLMLADRSRPARPGAIRNSFTFGWRALLKIKHVPEQLFDVTAFPIMFTLMFTFLFGGALAGSTSAYLQFLLPGILVQTTAFITMYTGLTMATDIEKGMFDRFRSLPVWQPSPLVGAMLGDAVRFAMASTMVIVLGLVLGFRPAGGIIGVLAGVALVLIFSMSLAWIWILVGLKVRTPNAVMGISMMVLFPLTFASNIFVDPATMPGWLQAFVDVNPLTHLVTSVRGAMAGVVEGQSILVVLAVSVALVAVFGPISMRRYRRR